MSEGDAEKLKEEKAKSTEVKDEASDKKSST